MKKLLPIVISLVLLGMAIAVQGATQQSQTVNATLVGQAPFIIQIWTDQSSYDPTENSTTAVTVYMRIIDNDGIENLNTSSFYVNATNPSEPTLNHTYISCGNVQTENSTTLNCTATINMQYYNIGGTWTVTGYVEDIDGNSDINSTTFTYNTLEAWAIDKNTIEFGSFYLSDTAKFPDNNTLTNTGNVHITEINVTAYDLWGLTQTDKYLPVNSSTFRVGTDTTWATATGLSNATAITVSGADLDIYPSDTEVLYWGINPSAFAKDTPAQTYQNRAGEQWLITT